MAPIPGTDTVTINHLIDYDVAGATTIGNDTTTAGITIGAAGTLRFTVDGLGVKTLNFMGDFKCNSGGQLLMGTAATPITAADAVTFNFNYSAALANNKYNWLFNTASTTSVCKAYGTAKTRNTTLSAQAASGQNQGTFTDVAGWADGDQIIVATTTATGTETESMTIAVGGITGSVVTFTANFTNTHTSGADCSNMTSTVTFKAYNATYKWYAQFKIGSGNFILDNVAINNHGNIAGQLPSLCGWGLDGSSGPATPATMTMTNCAMQPKADVTTNGLAFYLSGATGSSVTDTAIYSSNNAYCLGVRLDQSSNLNTLDRCNFYKLSNGIEGGWGNGGFANTVLNSIFCGCTIDVSLGSQAFLTLANNKYYASSYCGFNFQGNATNVMITDTGSVYGVGPGGSQYNAADINLPSTALGFATAYFDTCTFNSTNFITGGTGMASGSAVSFGNCTLKDASVINRTYQSYGYFEKDTTNYRTANNSVAIYPTATTGNTTLSLNVLGKSGGTLAIAGYIRKTAAYGSSNLPSVTLSGLGMTGSNLVWTMTDTDDTWLQFVVYGTPTSSGQADLTITTKASAGRVDLDDLKALTGGLDTGTFDMWYQAQPIKMIFANSLGATDVWNVQTSQITASGSFGKQAKDDYVFIKGLS